MSVPRWIVPAILSALCLALVLALCGPHDAQQKNAQDSRQLADDFAVMQPLGLSGTGAEHVHTGQNSWYRTILTQDGTGSLVSRLDFSTMQESVLCNVEGCTHDSAACPAYLSGYGRVYVAGDTVYSIASERDEDGAIRSTWHTLRAHSLDGSSVRQIAQVDSLSSGVEMAICGTNIYHAAGNTMYMLDLSTGHETILSRSFAPQGEQLASYLSGWMPDGRLALLFFTPQQYIFRAMDASGHLEELCRVPAVNGLGNGCFDENAHYYYSEAETGNLYMLDLSTGQTSLFSDALCEWAVQHIWGDGNMLYTGSSRQLSVAGGRLLVQVDARLDPEDISGAPVPGRLFAFPLSGGQPEEVTLMDFYNGYAHPLAVQAETPAGFLVVGDRPSAGTAVLHGQDGGSYSMEVFEEHLALISPADYFSSTPNFRFFDQLPQPLPS